MDRYMKCLSVKDVKGCFTNLDGFGVRGDDDAEVLCDPVQEVSPHPEVVTHLDALAGADLELPLEMEHRLSDNLIQQLAD